MNTRRVPRGIIILGATLGSWVLLIIVIALCGILVTTVLGV